MKKIVILFLFFPNLLLAQLNLSGKIIDAKTKVPIPFVNLDNLITNLATAEDIIYQLTPLVFQLNEIKVGKNIWVDKELGVIKKSGDNHAFFNQMIQRPGLQRAVFMKNESGKVAFIKTLNFYMGNEMFNAPFRIRIYDDEIGKPGKDLLNKSVEYAASKKNSWNSFDISAYNLIVPENGFWVAVEWIKNDKYAAESISFDIKNADGTRKKGKTFTYYGPEIIQKFDTGYGLTVYKGLANKIWHKNYGAKGSGVNKREVNVDLLVKATVSIAQ